MPTPAEDTLNHLHRLTQKPGVQSTLILSRTDGAVVRASGLLVSKDLVADANGISNDKTEGLTDAQDEITNGSARRARSNDEEEQNGKLRSADDVARTVWKFFGAASGMVDDMRGEGEDEVRLLRLRMRRCELVIVPDPKYLLVVVHDTPAA